MIDILKPDTQVNLAYLRKELPEAEIRVESEKRKIERPDTGIDTSWIEKARKLGYEV